MIRKICFYYFAEYSEELTYGFFSIESRQLRLKAEIAVEIDPNESIDLFITKFMQKEMKWRDHRSKLEALSYIIKNLPELTFLLERLR